MAKKDDQAAAEAIQRVLGAMLKGGAVIEHKSVDVARSEVKQIQVPEGMKLKEAIEHLKRKDQQEENEVAVYHVLDCFPLDGAVAFRDAIEEIYGFVHNVETPGFWGPSPPTMVGVEVGPGDVKQVPWGRVEIPGVEGYLELNFSVAPHPKFVIGGQVKERHLPEIGKVIEATKARLKTHSIYKGKAFRLDLMWMRHHEPKRAFHPVNSAPKFSIPTDHVRAEDLIFSDAVQTDVELGLFTPIEQALSCRQHGIPLKRGVLLAGDYGTGKTLTAYVTARKAIENGFTFIYLADVTDLAHCFKIAAQYAPCVIFGEDVDRVVTFPRTSEVDAVLNSFDGIDTKKGEIITVLTTNHLDKIETALLRPGRCDSLIVVTRPDRKAAAKLVGLYGMGLLDPQADYEKIGDALAGHLPAEIREAVERAKLAAICRLSKNGFLTKGDGKSIAGHVTDVDILAAVHAMKNQHKLLEPKAVDKRSPLEKVAAILGESIGDHAGRHSTQMTVKALRHLGIDYEELESANQYIPELEGEEAVAAGMTGEDADSDE